MIDSFDVLVNLCNVLVYIIVIIIFFWIIISAQFNIIILEKMDIILLICERDKTFKYNIKTLLNIVKNSTFEIAKKQEFERNKENLKLLHSDLMPYIYGIVCLIIANIVYICLTNRKIKYSECLLFVYIFIGFFTEVLFYFIVINEWKYIGDFDLLNLISNQ